MSNTPRSYSAMHPLPTEHAVHLEDYSSAELPDGEGVISRLAAGDESVHQVENYLEENYLEDPGSYESISWSKVFQLNDRREKGFGCFQVRHKFRAKNRFGGYVVEEKLFFLDYEGSVVEVRDYSRD